MRQSYTVRHSGRGLVVTIPQAWADEHGVKAGDRLGFAAEGEFAFFYKEEGHEKVQD